MNVSPASLAGFNLRREALEAPASGIVEVFQHARGRDGLIPLWVGEGDLPTPDFIARPAADALLGGETFYTWQQGIPDLRAALARYFGRHFGIESGPRDYIVTGSGMQAIQLSLQAVAGAGDECVYLAPAWPNISAALEIAGGKAVPVGLDFAEAGWTLDMEKLEAAITPRTKALFVNTPSNPTGWAASHVQDRGPRSWISPAGTGSGSSPTRSIRCSGTARAPARRPSSTSSRRTTPSSTSIPFPRTGR